MRQVGAREARMRFAALLDAVAYGKTVLITRHGKPVARLVPVVNKNDTAAVIARMKAARDARASMSRAEILAAHNERRA